MKNILIVLLCSFAYLIFMPQLYASPCAVNSYGRVVCSGTPGGGCAVNSYGRVICN